MSWPVRSRLLGSFKGSPAAFTFVSLGTVPQGKTWLVKEWSIYNGGSGSRSFYLLIRLAGVTWVWDRTVLTADTVGGNFGRHLVLPAGYELGFQSGLSGNLDIFVSGAQLG